MSRPPCTAAAATRFTTRSTKKSGQIHVEVCSQCHPFYTGKQKILDSGGRVARFEKRYGKRKAGCRQGCRQIAAFPTPDLPRRAQAGRRFAFAEQTARKEAT